MTSEMIRWEEDRYCIPNGYDFWYSKDFHHFGLWKRGQEPQIYEGNN